MKRNAEVGTLCLIAAFRSIRVDASRYLSFLVDTCMYLVKQETPDAESGAPATDPPAVPPALAELIKSALRNVMPTIAASLKTTNAPASSAPVINLREVDK